MDTISLRRRHVTSNMQDVILCCDHANKYFVETNSTFIDYSCSRFCQNRCNAITIIYVLVCTTCFKNLQKSFCTLFNLSFGWNKHYIEKEDIEKVFLNGHYRFCTLNEAKCYYYFCHRQLKLKRFLKKW